MQVKSVMDEVNVILHAKKPQIHIVAMEQLMQVKSVMMEIQRVVMGAVQLVPMSLVTAEIVG